MGRRLKADESKWTEPPKPRNREGPLTLNLCARLLGQRGLCWQRPGGGAPVCLGTREQAGGSGGLCLQRGDGEPQKVMGGACARPSDAHTERPVLICSFTRTP